jgi:hypothetical protein
MTPPSAMTNSPPRPLTLGARDRASTLGPEEKPPDLTIGDNRSGGRCRGVAAPGARYSA